MQIEGVSSSSARNDPLASLARGASPKHGGSTFTLHHRMERLAWRICWVLFARWTPHRLQPLRRALLVLFGAEIHPTAMVRGSAQVWWPGNLRMGARAMLGPGVNCYNVSKVTLEDFAIVSQRAHLCTASHDVDDEAFPLTSRPIVIKKDAWVASEAFVGPGVTVGNGAVLGARAVATRDLEPWTVYAGNPATAKRRRRNHSRRER